MKHSARVAILGFGFLVAGAAFAAPREATTRILDGIRGRWNDRDALEVWLNTSRGTANDRNNNVLHIGDFERVSLISKDGGYLTILRVDPYGDIRTFLRDGSEGGILTAAIGATIPPNRSESSRRLPTGDEDIYVFMTRESIPREALWDDLTKDLPDQRQAGPVVAERIRRRLDAMPEGSVVAGKITLSIEGRAKNARGGPSLSDYSEADIEDYFADFKDEARTRGGIMPSRIPGLIHFVTGGFDLTPRSKANLEVWARGLTSKFSSALFVIEGHADRRGSPSLNLSLSQRRAESVRAFLVDKGVAVKRLTVEPRGSADPVCEDDNQDAWAKNRRVDFRIVRME